MAELCVVTKTWRSGAAWHLHELVRSLAEAGLTITLIAPAAEPAAREARHPRIHRVRIPREWSGGGRGPAVRAWASLRRIGAGFVAVLGARRRCATFLVTIPDPLVFTLPLFALLRLSGARLIFLVHDAEPHAWRLPRALRRVEHAAHGLSYRLATDLVVLAPSVRERLVAGFGMAKSKIRVVPHGPLSIASVPPLPGNGRLLLFGTLRRNKRVLEVIEAVLLARQLDPGVTLVVAGEPHPQERDYWARCEAAMAADRNAFELRLGYLPDDELPELVAGVDAFVLAYDDFESASGVAIVAALAGRPLIATDAGSLGPLFEAGLAGERIARPVTAAGIAEGIARFRATPAAIWRERAAAGVGSVRRTQSWEIAAAALLALIRSQPRRETEPGGLSRSSR